MADEPIGDEIVRALEAIRDLQAATRRHEKVLASILDDIEKLGKRLTAIEKAKRP